MELKRLGFLGVMRVFAAFVDLELAVHLSTQSVVWKHAFDRLLDDPFGKAFLESFKRFCFHAPWPSGVAAINLLLGLLAADPDFFSIHDNDEITGVEMRGEAWIALATQDGGNFCCQTPEGLILSVH